ncbi:hypothetical protein, partial [Pseudomonas indica]|uniref:hypothetical protein n=1 Tax=Pseudomonas indica TaxID=137658 RepID=UPI0023F6B6A4
MQGAVGEEAAAGVADVSQRQVEALVADVAYGAALVAQALAGEAESAVADFHQAVVVIELAVDGEGALAACRVAQSAQFAVGVAQAAGLQIQSRVG